MGMLIQMDERKIKTVPAILITSYDKDHVLHQKIYMAHCMVLNKPFDFDDLFRTVQSLIRPA